MTDQEAAIERGKQINNLARRVIILERQNRKTMLALRTLAAYAGNEEWLAVVAELDEEQSVIDAIAQETQQ